MSEEKVVSNTPASTVESPPPADLPAREPLPDPRVELLELAAQLRRQLDRRHLAHYLRLRRSVR